MPTGLLSYDRHGMHPSPRLTVVIVSYNSAEQLPTCLASIGSAAPGLETTVVVVDNASQDSSAEIATSLGAEVIRHRRNLGFAAAVNAGVRAYPAGYVLILNPDVVLTDGSVAQLTGVLDTDDALAAVGPAMVDENGAPNTDGYYLRHPTLRQVAIFYTRLLPFLATQRERCRTQVECGLAREHRDVEQVPGACLLTRAGVLDNVGLLDEDYLLWFEDVDWSWRARKAGYRLQYAGSITVTHEGGTSFVGWNSIAREVVFYRSMLTFFRKHDRRKVPAVVALVVVDRLARLVFTRRWYQAQFLWHYLRDSAALPGEPGANPVLPSQSY